jgi:hypothetical protein
LFERGAEKRFPGKKHHHEFRRGLKLLPIFLSTQRIHVVAHLPRMIGQTRPTRVFVVSLEGIEERLQWRLCIDHDVLASRQLHDQIRPQPAALGIHGFLLGKIAIGEHAGDLDHAAQLNFSPASADVRSSQRADQIASFRLQFFLRHNQRLHLGMYR